VQNGGSLELWSRYFPNAERLVGCDIDTRCAVLTFADPRIELIIGDANTDQTESQIIAAGAPYDLIIDDGSHRSVELVTCFCRYFPRLKDGGLYVAEDLHGSYWKVLQGGLHDPFSSMSFFKRLADVVNHEHWGVDRPAAAILDSITRHYDCSVASAELAHIHSVGFMNSMCVVTRAAEQQNLLGRRVIVGQQALVNPLRAQIADEAEPPPDESDNPWSAPLAPFEEQLRQQRAEIARLAAQAARTDELAARARTLEGTIADLQSTLVDARLHSARLARQLAEGQHALASILRSRSWRLTRPFRTLKSLALGVDIRSPDDGFDPDWYLEAYPDVAADGCDPLHHYQQCGRAEGRFANRLESDRAAAGRSHEPVATRAVKLLAATLLQPSKLVTAWRVLRRLGPRGVVGVVRQKLRPPRPRGTYRPGRSYGEWLREFDAGRAAMIAPVRAQLAAARQQARIAIVMPTFNSRLDWLDDAIASVVVQSYPYWELCIADDASTDPAVTSKLAAWSARDPRIRVTVRDSNGHISAASNTALALVDAPWVALLDHDDLLHPNALEYMAAAILNNPEAGLFYSDEDKIDARGQRSDPHFKPDWNLELFYSYNLVCHLSVYATGLVREVGGFRRGFEGSQDHDLALRCIERLNPTQIVHVPYVLYHWRMHAQSTAANADSKPYAQLAGIRALNEHFERSGVIAHAEACQIHYRVRFALPDPPPRVTIIIPTRNGLALTRQCIESLYARTTYPDFEIILIDNGSDDPEALAYFSALADSGQVKVIRDERAFNYSALNNLGARAATGDFLCLLNNDIEVITPDWLEEMVAHASRPNVGAVGARLWYPDNTLQHAGVILGIGGVAGHVHLRLPRGEGGYVSRAERLQSLSAVTGACLLVRKSSFQAVGGLNERDLSVAFNDIDFCLRLREAGYHNVWTPFAELYHHESATRGYEDTPEKKQRFAREASYMRKRWGALLDVDPAYNPNLTLEASDFSLAWPPGTLNAVD
jgi:GT2 family glycosyltransferase